MFFNALPAPETVPDMWETAINIYWISAWIIMKTYQNDWTINVKYIEYIHRKSLTYTEGYKRAEKWITESYLEVSETVKLSVFL